MNSIVYRNFVYTSIVQPCNESVQISLAKKAWDSLSNEAKLSIEEWERYNWIGGRLEKHIIANDEIARELANAMKPILDSIKGDTVTLYRGTSPKTLDESRVLQSWSSSEKVAKHFAGLSSSQIKDKTVLFKVYSEEEIDAAVDQFNKKGFLKFDNRYYVLDKDNNGYYKIYDRDRQFLTDGDDLKSQLIEDNQYKQERNESKPKNSIVLTHTFNKNRIIWITNNLNSKEYIMRVD